MSAMMGKVFWRITNNIREEKTSPPKVIVFLRIRGADKGRSKKTFGESPSTLHELRLLAKSNKTFFKIKHEIKGDRGDFREPPIGLNTLELWARLRPFGDSPNALGDPHAFFSLSFQPFCSFLPGSVHTLPQTPNT
ncbi:hypothetical protein H5410_031035 [Solanum commersonii]|uniref:Uncharacterized protein n=1 Tax=Solanum commersonii TaxID=4109 RepID=A0A9J5YHB4_SOLCO|nr:hypothetical protein H5410_031035 [Solanum commersonii]